MDVLPLRDVQELTETHSNPPNHREMPTYHEIRTRYLAEERAQEHRRAAAQQDIDVFVEAFIAYFGAPEGAVRASGAVPDEGGFTSSLTVTLNEQEFSFAVKRVQTEDEIRIQAMNRSALTHRGRPDVVYGDLFHRITESIEAQAIERFMIDRAR